MTNIYALSDPRNPDDVRYIGKTVRPILVRAQKHLNTARLGGRNHRCTWLRSLPGAPIAKLILSTEDRYASAAEKFAIALMRAAGADLVNATEGGEGTPGLACSSETRAKRSVSMKGKNRGPRSPETKAKIGAKSKGNKNSLGRLCSPETRARISAAKKGRTSREPRSLETRMKISATKRARPYYHSEGTRAKMRGSRRPKPA